MLRTMIVWMLAALMTPVVIAQDADSEKPAETKTERKPEMRRRTDAKNPRRRVFDVKNPKTFKPIGGEQLFSGPQAGEKLLAFQTVGVHGDLNEKEFDPLTKVKGKTHLLIFMDENGVGVRGMFGFVQAIEKIRAKTDKPIHLTTVFLGDDPSSLTQFIGRFSKRLSQSATIGVSQDGREGPGNYGLNRNIAMTVLVAEDGTVKHNFPMPQSMLYPDPHLLGAVADAIDIDYDTVKKWLNAPPSDRQQSKPNAMKRQRAMEKE